LVEDDNKIDTFTLADPGIYKNSSFLGKVNSTYTMIVDYEGIEYKATSTILPVTTIDSLVYKTVDSNSVSGYEYSLFGYANRTSADYTSYYKVKLYRNDSLYNSYSDLLLFDDLYFGSFKDIEFPQTYWAGDTIKVEVYSLDEAVFNFYVELLDLTQGNLNTIYYYPLNPKTNISNGAFGVFQASSVSSTEIILP